ncbi:unnamed protein product (macronuclear) [Paramecium tetraurelia]|uniref:Uncharacterized protein n=1 Tax=Paramecium tetraurelia TaxID=5888 RepID=A0DAT6_PARTE|nr:uncharacterized protein GSPATT00015060001 [Paramecium tetraurelia]CAK80153.1 unnamed protein product [Paramecium tetraurelia]|eukprot:XP_001447550.1 hypothetical protein (macronuclear) [Paramecium tetraurelia strain d4-2]
MNLQRNDKRQNLNLNLLWKQLVEMQIQFKQRNYQTKNILEVRLTYTAFLYIFPFLYLRDVLKLRLLNSSMNEMITNYLLYYRQQQSNTIRILEIEIQQEKEKLPILYYQILQKLIKRSSICAKELMKLNDRGLKQMPTYNPLLVMQVAECEGIELFKIIPEELFQMKSYLIFLDFSKYTDLKRMQLLEFYEEKLQQSDYLEQQMNYNDRSELFFLRLARMWLKQTFYQDTYKQFRLIMMLIKKKEQMRWVIRQLEVLEKITERIT